MITLSLLIGAVSTLNIQAAESRRNDDPTNRAAAHLEHLYNNPQYISTKPEMDATKYLQAHGKPAPTKAEIYAVRELQGSGKAKPTEEQIRAEIERQAKKSTR